MQAPFPHNLSALELQDLQEIVVWDPANWVGVIIRNSEQPSLNISGDAAMIQRYGCWREGNTLFIKLGGNLFDRIADALTTSLTRKRIQVVVRISSLERVSATGMVQVDLADWKGVKPEIHINGPTALWGGRFPVMKL